MALAESDGSRVAFHIPFDAAKLDTLLDDAHIDVVLATSKHNVRYMLGGYRFFFFAQADTIGTHRYTPVVGYVKGAPEKAFYIGSHLESWQQDLDALWTPEIHNATWNGREALSLAANLIAARGLATGCVAIEHSFLAADAAEELHRGLPNAQLTDAHYVLEELRAVKRPAELDLLRRASEGVVDAMVTVFDSAQPGMTKAELGEMLRQAETRLGLEFEYALVTAGTDFHRAPSPRPWLKGEALSLDSGGNLDGYIGDLARMGICGQPTALMEEVLEEVAQVQALARRNIRPGALGREMYDAVNAELPDLKHANLVNFVAHGVGLISHEAPRLTDTGPVPYSAEYANRPLLPGMVLSIETTITHPLAGFIKLEDTVAVTTTGNEAYGDKARFWNLMGTHS